MNKLDIMKFVIFSCVTLCIKNHQFKIMLIYYIINFAFDFSHYNDNSIPHNKLHTFKYQIYIKMLVLRKSTCKHHISARICLEKKAHYDLWVVELMDESLNNFESNNFVPMSPFNDRST